MSFDLPKGAQKWGAKVPLRALPAIRREVESKEDLKVFRQNVFDVYQFCYIFAPKLSKESINTIYGNSNKSYTDTIW